MRDPGFRTPRAVMQRCSASMTTPTPRAPSTRSMHSAICVVRRSCTCGRFAKISTARASLESPTMRQSGR